MDEFLYSFQGTLKRTVFNNLNLPENVNAGQVGYFLNYYLNYKYPKDLKEYWVLSCANRVQTLWLRFPRVFHVDSRSRNLIVLELKIAQLVKNETSIEALKRELQEKFPDIMQKFHKEFYLEPWLYRSIMGNPSDLD